MIMLVKDFDTLCKRDFGNGAVLNAIRNSLKEREALIKASQQAVEDGRTKCGCDKPELYLHDGECENCLGVLFPPRSLT